MKYMGSKSRIAKQILPIILKDRKEGQYYVEPFCGGCNTIDKVTGYRIASDSNPYLIRMWESLMSGWNPPMRIERDYYEDVRECYNKKLGSYPDNIIGWVGFMGSFNGRFFDGGYSGHAVKTRNYIGEAIRNTLQQVPELRGTTFLNVDYKDLVLPPCSIIYCDPPYKGVKKYSYSINHEEFWEWCRQKVAEGHKVFVSEYSAPDDFVCLWEHPVKTAMNQKETKHVTEKLFIHKSQAAMEAIKKETGKDFEIKNGNIYYNGTLNLNDTSISLPDNLTVSGSLYLRNTNIAKLPESLKVGGSIDLSDASITELPENLTVGGYLDLRNTCITKLPNGLTVRKELYLCGSRITELSEDLVVGGDLDLRGTSITRLPEGVIVGGSLLLSSAVTIQLPKGLTVGYSIHLGNACKTELPEGLTVGGSLDLEGTDRTELPENLTVRGSLDLSWTNITRLPKSLRVRGDIITWGRRILGIRRVNHNVPSLLQWRGGKYIKVDGIFSEVVSHRGNVYIVKQIGDEKVRYLVTDGAGKWAHGNTLKDAKADLVYKIANRDKSAYAGLSLDSELSFEDAIEAYRVITGACSAGTKMFVENDLTERKDKYTISEIIRLTKGQYNSEAFRKFFEKI